MAAIGALQITPGATGTGGSSGGFIPYSNAGQASLTIPQNAYAAKPVASTYNPYPNGNVGTWGTGVPQPTPPANNQAAAQQAAAAQAAAVAQARANAQANINTGINNAMRTGQSSIDQYGNLLNSQGQGYALAHEGAIQADNFDRQNINMNKLASLDDLQNTIRQGLNTSQLGMGNGNAMASSGAEGAARAYSEFGAHGANTVNGQANLGLAQDTSKDQTADMQLEQGMNALNTNRQNYIDMIRNGVQSALDSLAGQAQQAGLSPVDVAGHVNDIIAQGQAKLGALDQTIRGQAASVAPISDDQAMVTAGQNYRTGFQPTNGSLYSYGLTPATNPLFTQPAAPTQPGAGAGVAPIAALPLFTKEQTQPVV